MPDIQRNSAPISAIVDSPGFAPLKQELRAWVEERLAEALNPGRGRRLRGLPAVLARPLRDLPARERRALKERFRPAAGPRRPLADRLSTLAELRPRLPSDGLFPPGKFDDVLTTLLPRVTYEITGVRCDRSTHEVGADEFYATVIASGPVGAPVLLGPRKLGDFRRGDRATFSPPIVAPALAMANVDGFQSFVALVYCAEVDSGEYLDLMPAIYEELVADGIVQVIVEGGARGYLATVIVAEVMAALAGLGLALVNPVAGVAVLAAAIAAIVIELAALWRADEMFTLQVDTLELPIDTHSPPAAQLSPARSLLVSGYGAAYTLTTRWRLA
ncbi:MAG: hypothetical protein K1X87_09175 [Dehalococcoidia bacterium]|nr:hypothetical protein [Dehalococcoidia bacterium]